MESFKFIKQKTEKFYEEYKKDNGDITAWSLLQKIKKETNYNDLLTSYFIFQLHDIAYDKGEIINLYLLLAELISFQEHTENYNPRINKEAIELFPKLIFQRGLLTNILERLELNKTLRAFYYFLMIREEEINVEPYLTKDIIKKYSQPDVKAIGEVLGVFNLEYKEKKLDSKPRIIKISKAKPKT